MAVRPKINLERVMERSMVGLMVMVLEIRDKELVEVMVGMEMTRNLQGVTNKH